MSVALPMMSPLHFWHMHGSNLDLKSEIIVLVGKLRMLHKWVKQLVNIRIASPRNALWRAILRSSWAKCCMYRVTGWYPFIFKSLYFCLGLETFLEGFSSSIKNMWIEKSLVFSFRKFVLRKRISVSVLESLVSGKNSWFRKILSQKKILVLENLVSERNSRFWCRSKFWSPHSAMVEDNGILSWDQILTYQLLGVLFAMPFIHWCGQ